MNWAMATHTGGGSGLIVGGERRSEQLEGVEGHG